MKRLLFLGSSCIYPKLAPQPLKEEYLLTGPLEPTNEAYAVAKIAGITMCRAYNRQYGTNFLAAMPTNLYGPGDNFDLEKSHVLPALIRKFHEAKETGAETVTIWGTGSALPGIPPCGRSGGRLPVPYESAGRAPTRHSYSLHSSPALINIGTGEEVTIRELALLVKDAVGFEGELVFDTTKPDGTPRKLCDVSKLHGLGWKKCINLKEGTQATYAWYRETLEKAGNNLKVRS